MRDFMAGGRSVAVATKAMAATSHPLATLTALDIMRDGGNALDGAIAAAAVQAVVEPGSTGIGGDCFVLYAREGSADVIGYNGSGRAPRAVTLNKISALGCGGMPRNSPYAVTIPGAIEAWARLAHDHGRLGLERLLQPAIRLARDGYPVTPRVHADWVSEEALLQADPAAQRIMLVNDRAPILGSQHRQPELAATLALIARDGPHAFYRGSVAADMVERLQQAGGCHTHEDFATHQGTYVTPIRTCYRGHEVLECPPNGQGLIALILLAIFERLPSSGCYGVPGLLEEVEAARLAYSIRDAVLGDPDDPGVAVETLLSPRFIDQLVGTVRSGCMTDPLPLWSELVGTAARPRDTVYISVVDKDRNAASFINSLFWGFGSGIMAPRSGVMLQNRGMSFSLDARHPNVIAPGKRPMHTIIPGMLVKDNRVTMPFGVMGGHYQALGHAWFLRRVLEDGLDLQEAMQVPRLFPEPGTHTVSVERGVPVAARAALTGAGYRVTEAAEPLGGSQAIAIDWDRGTLIGGSDPRKDGLALGY